MHQGTRALALALAIGTSAVVAVEAQTLPPGVFAAERDITLAAAGAYTLDEAHTAVIARVFETSRIDPTRARLDPTIRSIARRASASLERRPDVRRVRGPKP